jgi:hypothetical protein
VHARAGGQLVAGGGEELRHQHGESTVADEGDQEVIERLLSALVGAGIGVREATPARASLEDVFVQLTVEHTEEAAESTP